MTRAPNGNPWVAVRPDEDIAALARTVSTAHRSFVDGERFSPVDRRNASASPVRPVVFDSWLRSRNRGVDPDGIDETGDMDVRELERYRDSHPMALIRPVVRKLLVEDAADTGLLVAISDAAGRLLWVEGDSSAKDRALAMNFVEGADWSEDRVGTNAPGTALAVDHCVQIFGAEHFSRTVHDWSCSAAPVHDPMSGQILGAIDITGGPRVAVPEVLALVRATVAAAESELRLHLLNSPRLLGDAPPRLAVLGSQRPTVVAGGDRIPLSRRHAEILLLLADHPEGLSSGQLAVLLDESELDSVTIRAEMSRLRKVFGAQGLGSRPYRLLTDLSSDVEEVRRALEQGDAAGALTAYRGPVLPGSVAPGIEDIRSQLRGRMQAALLRAGDRTLLARWTATVEGRHDTASWTAYLSSLDPQSPMYGQVRAGIDMLDGQLTR
ncbi:transcriptional regulator [Rhodococcus spelaei]|uniref:Transcriptional regulator n=1 Tax=Rhodococcus spelaei TaxID=2546320 RepID=A0A541B8V5_9NOCA|nr:transcriptional regulator [Rhodococcus spelaei]TQF68760.1 transcriptional regulator [Rhodococcus spelaei]